MVSFNCLLNWRSLKLELNPIAAEINEALPSQVFSMLSKKGGAAFFPKLGIMGQSADAKGTRYNATIGIALEDDLTPMRLGLIADQLEVEPKDAYPYAPSYGKPELREKWQTMIKQKNPDLKGEISLPVVTTGLTHGISVAAALFLNPEDTLICADLYWGNYNLMVTATYGSAIEKYTTFKGEGFDLDAFKQALSKGSGKKVVILNCPNNPSGYSPTIAEAEQMIEVIKERAEAGDQIVTIIDDAYFGLVYEEGIYKQSLFAPLADLHENVLAVKIDGATKEDYVWGFRVGFITFGNKGMTAEGYSALADKAAGIVRGTVSNVSHPAQSVLFKAYQASDYEAQKQEKFKVLKARYQKAKEELSSGKYDEFFTPLPFNSGYFMCVQLKNGLDSEPIRQVLLKEHDTGLIGLGDKFRIAYSCLPEADISVLFNNLASACSSVLAHA